MDEDQGFRTVCGGRLSENSKDGKFSPTNNEKTGINCQYISHFNAENCNENGIESHQLLVFGQSEGGDPLTEYQDSHFSKELKESDLYILTEFFKVLGNPTRIRILLLLMEQDSCVGDLAEQLGITQSAVSHQLNLLKSNKLVRRRRDGKMIFYTLVDEHVQMVLEKGTEHILQR